MATPTQFLKTVIFGLLLSLSLMAHQTFAVKDKPQRIVSLSLCTDQPLLMLVEPDRIQALSYLSQQSTYSYMAEQAQGLPIHYGLAEEIIPLKPDLIIASVFERNNTITMLRTLGYTVHTFESPTTLTEIEAFTRDIGNIVGEPEKAETVIKNMHKELELAREKVAQLPTELALTYGPNGFTAGKNTLKHHILAAAGYRNLSAELGIAYYGNLSVEQLVASNPDIVIIDEDVPNNNSLAQRYTSHPALSHMLGTKGLTRIPTNQWLCPGPTASKAVLSLVDQR